MSTNKRKFNRVEFKTNAIVHTSAGAIELRVGDISLKGLKLIELDQKLGEVEGEVRIEIPLGSGECFIELFCRRVYHHANESGFEITCMDMDSAVHLRRLLEFNLKDPSLFERDLNALVNIKKAG